MAITVRRLRGGEWSLSSDVDLTDEEAMALTFIEAPEALTVGRYVEVIDPSGIRAGRIATVALRPGTRSVALASLDLS